MIFEYLIEPLQSNPREVLNVYVCLGDNEERLRPPLCSEPLPEALEPRPQAARQFTPTTSGELQGRGVLQPGPGVGLGVGCFVGREWSYEAGNVVCLLCATAFFRSVRSGQMLVCVSPNIERAVSRAGFVPFRGVRLGFSPFQLSG
jgi:hypothetical protein